MNNAWRSIAVLLLLTVGATIALAQGVIKPNDTIRLMCEEEPALNRDYKVTDDGLVLVQYLGAVKVGGLTEKQAGDTISKQLVDEKILPKATVIVQIARIEVKNVSYQGAVRLAAESPWQPGLKLSKIIQLAEPLPTTDLTKVTITSATGQAKVVDATKEDPELQPGDRISFVNKPDTSPPNTDPPIKTDPPVNNSAPNKIMVTGYVFLPADFDFSSGMTLQNALVKAGGFTSAADPTRVILERDGTKRELRLPDEADFALQKGDRLTIVAKSNTGNTSGNSGNPPVKTGPVVPPGSTVTLSGSVNKPGAVPISQGTTLTEAIKAAGGFVDGARKDKIRILTPGNVKPREINYRDIELRYMGDILLRPGQTIEIPGPSAKLLIAGSPNNTTKMAAGAVFLAFLLGR